jgi:transposase-like protein
MKNESRAHRAYPPQEIAEWVRRYRGSGQSLGAFAHEHGLARHRLHYWVYDKRSAQLNQPSGVPLVFQELKVTPGLAQPPWALEVSLPAGAVARFSAGVTPTWIGSVVEALRRPC